MIKVELVSMQVTVMCSDEIGLHSKLVSMVSVQVACVLRIIGVLNIKRYLGIRKYLEIEL